MSGARLAASFGQRFGAVLVDYLVFFIIGSFLSTVAAIVAHVVYMVAFHSTTGSTLGQRAMGIRLVGNDGTCPITPSLALARYFARILSMLALGLGFLWMLWDPERRTWHDILTQTRVQVGLRS